MIHSQKLKFFVIGICAVFVFTGCDQINKLLGRDTEKSQETASQQPSGIQSEPETNDTSVTKADKPLGDNEIARVGDWRLSKEEFDQRLQNVAETIEDFDPDDLESQALILDELIRQQLLVQEAQQLGLDESPDIKQAVEDFRRTLLVQQLSQDLIEDVTVTTEDARTYYEENTELFIIPVEYRVREIVTFTEQGAKELLVQILQGADFASLAQQQSKAESRANGGDLGYITQAGSPQVQNVISSLNIGGVSSVFQGPEGYHIVKLEDKRGGQPRPFGEIEGQLIEALTAQKQQQAVLQRLSEIAQETTIEINQDYFGPLEESVSEE